MPTAEQRASISVPPPLTADELAGVPGVLGTIARQRADDYRASLAEAPSEPAPPRPDFVAPLQAPGVAVIAEVKRSSPSQGALRDIDPVALAQAYRRGGAAAISVLTEPRHFGGALEHLEAVAAAVPQPLLRKDFVVHPAQLVEARAAGASAVLLIAAVLGHRLAAYRAYASGLGLASLVEIHDEAELELALAAQVAVLGVNNRDLRSLAVDRSVAPRLLGEARRRGFDGVGVAESGYHERAQVAALEGVADAVLVGSSLVASGDPEGALRRLLGAP